MATELAPCPECETVHPETVLKCPETDKILDLSGRLLDEKFRLLAQVGSGGMASVWLATNLLVDKNVAIKLIRPDFIKNEETVTRFRNEARAAGRIGNPHICDILDLGTSPIGPYIVMELLVGYSLADLITEEGRLAAPLAAAIARQALSGLAAAHDAGIVHRDLKPENVFLHRPEGARAVVKLMDFGVSKFTDGSSSSETAQGVLLGTPQFMSPEQVRGAKGVDRRADLWAMGAILYRALTGTDAFLGPTVAATLLNVAKETYTPITGLAPDVPAGLEAVVDRCLCRDIDRRFQTAQQLNEALEPYAAIGPLPETAPSGRAAMGAGSGQPTLTPPPDQATSVFTRDRDSGKGWGIGSPRWLPFAGVGLVTAGLVAVLTMGSSGESNKGPPAPVDPIPLSSATPVQMPTDPPAPEPRLVTKPESKPDGAPDTKPEPELELRPEPGPEEPPNPMKPDATSRRPVPSRDPTTAGARPEIAGTIHSEEWMTPKAAPTPIGHRAARDHCRALASAQHLGVGNWHLANPAVAGKFAGKPLKRGRWWTAANWRGEGKTITLPGGRRGSAKLNRKYRPLCVARTP